MANDSAIAEPDTATLLPGRTAFLIIHGVGQQNKFETLSRFAAGLRLRLDAVAGTEEIGVRRELDKLGKSPETYISLQVEIDSTDDAVIEVDVYEYYYQPMLQRQVEIADVIDWLLAAANRIRKLYDRDTGLKERRKKRHGGVGDKLEDGYMLVPVAKTLPVIILAAKRMVPLLKQASESTWWLGPLRPVVRFVLSWAYGAIAKKVGTLITEFAGDVTAYTAIDPKQRLHDVRTEILDGCTKKIWELLHKRGDGTADKPPPYYDRLIVAGHSLGTVVGYDALSWVSNDIAAGTHSYDFEPDRRLCGFVTFGSPLDKIALFFWPVSDEELEGKNVAAGSGTRSNKAIYEDKAAEFQVGMLDYFHGMRGLRETVATFKPEITQPPARPLEHVAWLNFYHPRDAIAGHLDAYAGVKNLRRFGENEDDPSFPESHSFYWYDPDLYDCLIACFLAPGGVDRRDKKDVVAAKLEALEQRYSKPLPNDAAESESGKPTSPPPRPGPPLNR